MSNEIERDARVEAGALEIYRRTGLDMTMGLCRELARAVLAAADAVGGEAVAAQCRFKGASWERCSVEHARMVLAAPHGWPDYEVRLLYTHPAHWSDELIAAIARMPKVARYVDMPLQHVAEGMLRDMRRETSETHIRELVAKLRAGIPGLAMALGNAVGVERGLPTPRTLGGLRLPRISDVPSIQIEIIPSREPSGGLGEIGTAAVAPAIANALWAGSGRRYRSLPLLPGNT